MNNELTSIHSTLLSAYACIQLIVDKIYYIIIIKKKEVEEDDDKKELNVREKKPQHNEK